jgi:hypothetical protein
VEDVPEAMAQLGYLINSDDAFCIFRRFGPCTAQLLIRYQIELDLLDKELRKLEEGEEPNMRSRLGTIKYSSDSWGQNYKNLLRKYEKKIKCYCRLIQSERLQSHKVSPALPIVQLMVSS